MRMFVIAFALIASGGFASAEEKPATTIDTITKSAKDLMPLIPSLPSVSLPSVPDLSIPDFSDTSGKMIAEFNSFTQQVGTALPILEQIGYEVSTFKVTWGLPPKARLRLKSSGATPTQKIEEIAAKGTAGTSVLVSALINSAVAAKRIQNTMKLGAAFLDVDFALPPRVNMRFVNTKAAEKEESRDLDDLEITCR